jgi:CMP/dCMP kinase
MKITISGTAGSGKSTIARLLAERLGYNHYSMGDFQREIAKEKGISIIELGELEKTDPTIDRMVDEKQKNLGRTQDNFVIDSWLSSYFIPDSYKVFLDADIEERARRIAVKREAEHHSSPQEAAIAIRQREKTNRERWIEFYGYDFMDMKNYDLVIDTTGREIKEVLDLIYSKVK